MTHTFLQALPFALGGAISPTMLAVAVVLLAAPKQGRLKGFLFFLGALAFSIAFCIAVHFLLKGVGVHRATKGKVQVDGIVDVVIGALLVLWAILRVVRGPKPADAESNGKDRKQLGLAGALVAGLVMMATNLSTLPLYALAIRVVGNSKLPEAEQLAELALITAIVLIPVWFPVALATVAPKASQRVLGAIREFLDRHSWTIITVILVVIGFYLVIKGGPNIWAARP